MQRTLHEKSCDQCNKKAIQQEGTFGGHAHRGWITVDQVATSITDDRDSLFGDFCSTKCLKEYIVMWEEANNGTDK